MEKDMLSQGRPRESNSGKADEPTYRTSIAVDPLTPRHNPATGGTPSLKSSANNPTNEGAIALPHWPVVTLPSTKLRGDHAGHLADDGKDQQTP